MLDSRTGWDDECAPFIRLAGALRGARHERCCSIAARML